MKCIIAFKNGLLRSLKAWKILVISWFIYLLMVSVLVLPLRTMVNKALAGSAVTERLAGGIDSDLLTDLFFNSPGITSGFVSGVFFLIVAGFLVNAFITGGVFSAVRKDGKMNSPGDFFSSASHLFWKFLGLTLIITLIIIFSFLFLVILPVGLVSNASGAPDKAGVLSSLLFGGIFIIIIGILLLVADYSRAALASGRKSFFGSLGFGFSETFRHFFPSISLMLIMLLIQAAYTLPVLWFTGIWRPATSGGSLLLLVVTQLLFSLKLLIKMVRYASITSLMEINSDVQQSVDQEQISVPVL